MDTASAFYFSSALLIFYLALYVFYGFCLMTIANKLGVRNSWLAFVPIANAYLMCRMAGYAGWYLLLFLVPFVNVVFSVMLWWKIAEARERPGWYGVLMLVPVANLVIPAILAFADVHHAPGGMMTPHAGV